MTNAAFEAKCLRASIYLFCVWFTFAGGNALSAQSVTVTNVFENHYNYAYPISPAAVDCPAGYNIPAGQYSSAYHLERGHAIHHEDKINSVNDYWVYWAHFDDGSYGTAEVAVFKSKNECGPYILQTGLSATTSIDGSGYGFQPGGWESRDEIIFRDDATQSYNPDGSANYAGAYLITASNSRNSIPGHACSYANDSIAIFKMTPDYMGVDYSTSPGSNGANWTFPCAQREAPVVFRSGSYYFLVVSQAAGWYPSQGAYGSSSNPLTGYPVSPINLGNSSTFGGQTSDGFTIKGTQASTYVLAFDHLGGDDSKNPSYTGSRRDSGFSLQPLLLDGSTGIATLNWQPSFTVDLTTGVLTLPSLPNLATTATATATIASGSSNPPALAIDSNNFTRWIGTGTGTASFAAVKPTTSTLCPITNATVNTTCNPSLVVDLGSVQPVQEVDLSWYMIKGSEPYYNFKLAYSSDKNTWNTLDYTAYASGANATAADISAVPFSNNVTYGFNSLPVNFSARYVALLETGEVVQNNSPANYGPNLYEIGVLKSTAPLTPQPVTVTLTPSASSVSPSDTVTVAVAVAGPNGQPIPSGYIQLSAPGYTSDTYGLINGANSYTIPAGSLSGGSGALTVSYRPDPTSAPVYGIGTTTGIANVYVSVPAPPTGLALTRVSPGALSVSWVASTGASSYVVYRSVDGGAMYTQLSTTTSPAFTDTGLNNDSTSYCYNVAAVNGTGTGTPSSPVCGAATISFPVTGVTVTPSGPGALTISYTAVPTATGYLIKRSVGGGAYAPLTTAPSTSFVDSGLALNGTSYCYTVAAVFSTGTASDSAPVCNTASNAFSPTDLQLTPWADGQLYLTWVANSSGSSYAVKRSVNGGVYSSLATTTLPVYTDTALINYSNVYCYTVSAVLNGVASSDSMAVCRSSTGNFLAVPNYSFELPSVGLWSTDPTFTNVGGSWSFVGNATNSGNNSGVSALSGTFTSANTPPIALGSQVGLIEGTGSLTQSLTGFNAGQSYTLTIAASQRQAPAYQSGGANPLGITLNGTRLATVTPLQAIPYYRDYSTSFTATAATNSIALVGTSTSTTSAILLDNVRLSTTGTGNSTLAVQPMTISQGTNSAVLTATESFSGNTSPSGALVFQVGTGTQVASTCTVSGTSKVCTATYPTANLPQGALTITASYGGDAVFASTSGTGTLTVSDASTASIKLLSTASLAAVGDGGYQMTVTVQNGGTTTATGVVLTGASVGGANGYLLPARMGSIPPGGSAVITLAISSAAGTSGSSVVERLNGSYDGGTFGGGLRAKLP